MFLYGEIQPEQPLKRSGNSTKFVDIHICCVCWGGGRFRCAVLFLDPCHVEVCWKGRLLCCYCPFINSLRFARRSGNQIRYLIRGRWNPSSSLMLQCWRRHRPVSSITPRGLCCCLSEESVARRTRYRLKRMPSRSESSRLTEWAF